MNLIPLIFGYLGRWRWLIAGCTLLCLAAGHDDALTAEPASDGQSQNVATAQSADQAAEFFQRHVRPLLVEHCQACHGPDQQENGLRVDSREALLQGGSRGAAIVATDVAASLLMAAVRYEREDLQMPPDGRLSDKQIAVLERWIEEGAVWPGDQAGAQAGREGTGAAPEHWAFQPLQRPAPPAVVNRQWSGQTIDRLVLARLEAAGLTPSPPADPQTLVRRLYLDLTGLPPSYDEVMAFVHDTRPDAYEQLVDRLLTSPQYAERWARHWLDIARYADTKGYLDGGQTVYPFAYTYRNYVLRALAEDLPYDEFLLDQLAADLLPRPEGQSWRLAGMGFLTTGLRFNANPHDILDDRIDLITRGLMGVTAACARCHDHKYDPVSTADYYSLYGILASSYEPTDAELPLLADKPRTAELDEYHQRLEQQWHQYRDRSAGLHRQIEHELRSLAADYLVYVVKSVPEHCADGKNPLKTDRTILRGPSAYGYGAFERWERYLQNRRQVDPIWGLWRRLFSVPSEQFGTELDQYLAAEPVNSVLRQAIAAVRPASMVELARCYGTVLEETYDAWGKLHAADPHAERFADDDRELLRQVLYGAESPTTLTADEAVDCYYLDEHVELRKLRSDIEKVSVEFAASPPRAMVVRERELPFEPRILVRGQPNRPGRPVPRRLPDLLTAMGVEHPVRSRSGRLELAQAIVDPRNPLTYRVIANRLWQWHFGQGLVTTPSDFGMRSQPPSHPELLDHLASELIGNGGSLKKLQRQIVTSRSYRQSSRLRPDAAAVDPSNRLLWRFEPRRVEWEVVRDALLASAQSLDRRRYGRSVTLSPDDVRATCRTLYLHVDRQDLSRLARTFDVASPDFSVGRRDQTTVPQQQLFFLNGELVIEMAGRIAQGLSQCDAEPDGVRVVQLFRWILSRDPSDAELSVALEYLSHETSLTAVRSQAQADDATDKSNGKADAAHMTVWSKLAQILLQSNERIVIE